MKAFVMGLVLITLNPFAQAFEKAGEKWQTAFPEWACTQPQTHFAIVVEHVTGTDNSVYCKLVTGSNYQYEGMSESLDCSINRIEVDSLILVEIGYFELWDKLGNKKCWPFTKLIKVIGKVTTI